MDIHEEALDRQDEARRRKQEREMADRARLEVFKQQILQNKVKQLMQQNAAGAAERTKKKAKMAKDPKAIDKKQEE